MLTGTLVLLAWTTRHPGLYAVKLLLALAAACLVWLLWSLTQRTNRLIARFVEALAHDDLAQGFRREGRGAGLDELGAAFDRALERMLAEAGVGDAAMADAHEAVKVLARRAAAIGAFVDAYRDFISAPAIKVRRFAAAPWLRELMSTFQAMPLVDASVVSGSVDEQLEIEADPVLLGQVLLNLLKNARQACASQPDAAIRVSVVRDESGRTTFQVSNNGPGISSKHAREIFLPFFTTKPDGSGIGLSFARQIVHLHDGAIGLVEPELGGTTIQIVL